MKNFAGSCVYLDRNDINTDEIIPAKYLTENSKTALKPYILEDLQMEGFHPQDDVLKNANIIVTRQNFGCGSSREHAVWVFEVNDINVVIAESFARIFRQNMFNCGMLAIELPKENIDTLFSIKPSEISVDLASNTVNAIGHEQVSFSFNLNDFDKNLIEAGGWLAYADSKY